MTHAAITGWGHCMPPAVLSNADLATFLETDDAWITSRTGIRERRLSHVPGLELAYVAASRALACAGRTGAEIDLVVYGSCSHDEVIPNTASGLQRRLGATRAAAMDLNTACTSFLYGLSTATAMIRTGVVRTALVVGVEVISPFMDWSNRNVAVLFGDGAAAMLLEASDAPAGVLGERLGCNAEARDLLRVRGFGTLYGNRGIPLGVTEWVFEGQDIFRHAIAGMSRGAIEVLDKCGLVTGDVDLVVPHQANLRIIEAVAKRVGAPMDKVMLTVERYGNMSSATVPVAMIEALQEGRLGAHDLVLAPAFGGGLTWCAHVIRWGERLTPIDESDAALPPCAETALDIVHRHRRAKAQPARHGSWQQAMESVGAAPA